MLTGPAAVGCRCDACGERPKGEVLFIRGPRPKEVALCYECLRALNATAAHLCKMAELPEDTPPEHPSRNPFRRWFR